MEIQAARWIKAPPGMAAKAEPGRVETADPRGFPRFQQDLPVAINDMAKGPEKFNHSIFDLSERGFSVLNADILEPGKQFYFDLSLHNGTLVSGKAECRWARPQDGLGWFFGNKIIDMSLRDARILHDHVKSLFKMEPIEYRPAATRWEREQAYRLLYRSYIRENYMSPNPGGIRFNKHLAGDGAVTFNALSKGAVIATMTLFMDGGQGLPIDQVFGDEVAEMRRLGRKVAEVGALAHRREDPHRGIEVFITLARMCAIYALDHGVTDCLITVNPRHKDIYPKMLGFERFSQVRVYSTVLDAPAMAYRLPREKFQPATRELQWFFDGPALKVPDHAPIFSLEDRNYFYSLANQSWDAPNLRAGAELDPYSIPAMDDAALWSRAFA